MLVSGVTMKVLDVLSDPTGSMAAVSPEKDAVRV